MVLSRSRRDRLRSMKCLGDGTGRAVRTLTTATLPLERAVHAVAVPANVRDRPAFFRRPPAPPPPFLRLRRGISPKKEPLPFTPPAHVFPPPPFSCRSP